MKKKNSTAQQKKVKFDNKHLNDPKIKKVYLTFKKQLYSQIKNEKFCIGVSGGPDSLALSFLCKIFSKEFNSRFVALIIDHNLRKQSRIEAQKVKIILTKHKIKSKILTWKGKIPKSNIQFNARNIRYFLLKKECNKLNIKNLVLAHHEGDLIENFFIRLFRGSGLKGLSSLNVKRHSEDNILNLIRPLINIKKNKLIYISKKVFKFYLTDPSNFEEKFLRTRIRNYLDKFKLDGLDINKIKLTLSNLQSANESINFYKEKSIKNHVRYLQSNACFVSYGLFNYESKEVIFRTINDIISKISDGYYPPRGKDVKNLISRIQSEKFNKSTLGGCIIERIYNILIFRKEFEA
jgi:tRNA(Ile)-lysidine synthase